MKTVTELATPWTPVHLSSSLDARDQFAISQPVDLLRTGAMRAARLLIAQETALPDDTAAAALITAAIGRLSSEGPIEAFRERLVVMAVTHLLLQVPPGADRDRLTDLVEEIVGRCPGSFV